MTSETSQTTMDNGVALSSSAPRLQNWFVETAKWARWHLPTRKLVVNWHYLRSMDEADVARLTAIGAKLSLRDSLALVLNWVGQACDAGKPGLSNGYHLFRGWEAPYLETTGYTIETLCRVSEKTGDGQWLERARIAGDWVLKYQAPNGSFLNFHPRRGYFEHVFDDAQLVDGLLSLAEVTGDKRYLEAARLTGIRLLSLQNSDGAWRTGAYWGIAHTYYTRAALPLLRLARATGHDRFAEGARRQLDWACSQLDNDGFPNSTFTQGGPAYTHLISYTMEGFLGGARILDEVRYLEAASAIAAKLAEALRKYGMLPGSFSKGWTADPSYTCLTGNAQTALCWLDIDRLRRATQFEAEALALLGSIGASLLRTSNNPALVGAVAGSYPWNGKYMPNFFPLWAAKFTVDAMLLALDHEDTDETPAVS